MARILFLEWNSFGNLYMQRAWQQEGDEVVSFPFSVRINTRLDQEMTLAIVRALMEQHYDYMFSFNYFPIAAMAAKACRVRYVSWVYDSPFAQVYSQTVHYETNEIYMFDRHAVETLRSQGVKTVQYLPLAADTVYYDQFVQKPSQYQADVSFVGALYTQQRQDLFQRFDHLPPAARFELNKILEKQRSLYGKKIIQEALTPELVAQMQEISPLMEHPDAFATKEWTYAEYYLYRHITAMERTELLESLAPMCKLRLYTSDKPSATLQPCVQAPVDYYTQAPYVYKQSKINLNITLRSIGSGIPLRCFDIMGCGGFLLTNEQEDFHEYFVPDVDYVCYRSKEELQEKVAYYLLHDKQRQEIAQHGYEKVKAYHSYTQRVRGFRETCMKSV